MIHFFATFADDAGESPLAGALRQADVPCRLFARDLTTRYQRRAWLVLVGLPKLVGFALHMAWLSLVKARPRPDAVVVVSHVQALVFWLVAKLLFLGTRIYLLGFIYTRRDATWLDTIRQRYFNALLSRLDGVIVHSALESRRYNTVFPAAAGRFIHVPYGLHVHGASQAAPSVAPDAGPAFSAGRSGRDYATLTKVFATNGRPLRIACDYERSLEGTVSAPNIVVLRSCYDSAYVDELRRAAIVIVPLGVGDISAGQMVVVQAMAFRKPIVATASPTLDGYVQDGVDALLVAPNDAHALAAAVERLIADPDLAWQLAERAHQGYLARHSMSAFVNNILRVIRSADEARAG